jgi:hypothetical protein
MSDRSEEFLAIAREAGQLAERGSELDEAPLQALEDAALNIGKAWSGSSLGFQGRLGWTKAIVLLEEGCEEFSNIAGNIRAALDEIREVLGREGLLPPS